MRFFVVTTFALFLCSAVEVFAAPGASSVPSLVQDYYLQELPKPRPLPEEPQCGSPRGCVEAACGRMSRFECDDRQELLEITRACRNVSGECVNNLCNRMSRFSCDDRAELIQVAGACRGLVDMSCVDYVCSRLSRFDCDEFSELAEIARQCR